MTIADDLSSTYDKVEDISFYKMFGKEKAVIGKINYEELYIVSSSTLT